jgi:hypothetical protein
MARCYLGNSAAWWGRKINQGVASARSNVRQTSSDGMSGCGASIGRIIPRDENRALPPHGGRPCLKCRATASRHNHAVMRPTTRC